MTANENEAYVDFLCGHLDKFVRRLREIPADKWEWAPALPAPSPRVLAEHAWSWLVCDRQHILEPEVSKHARVPDPPSTQQHMCDVLSEESQNWKRLILSLTPTELPRPGLQFGDPGYDMNVRDFICHMVQHVIYKHGELATIYFALGLDGDEKYTVSFPNDFYGQDLSK